MRARRLPPDETDAYATVADAPDSLGRPRGPMHLLLERRRWRGPEPQGMLAAVAEDAVDP